MTHSLTKASCAACVRWQGAREQVQAGDKRDQTSVTFERTLPFQMAALRSWAPGVDTQDPLSPGQVYLGEGEVAGTTSRLGAQSLPRDVCAHISEPTVRERV